MSKKTNFVESILLTLSVMVVGIILGGGYWLIGFLFPDKPAIMYLYGIFNLWFFGFLLNRFWGFKLKV